MSKHGIEAYTDALADDARASGVQVSVVEPGNYRSEITKHMIEHMSASPDGQKAAATSSARADRSEYKEPDDVAASGGARAVRREAAEALHGGP
jgi:NAD(P)-dependent dehydrogenase (short-subunit alcohol dehydrogenase family)